MSSSGSRSSSESDGSSPNETTNTVVEVAAAAKSKSATEAKSRQHLRTRAMPQPPPMPKAKVTAVKPSKAKPEAERARPASPFNGHLETPPQMALGLHNISVSDDDARHEYPERLNLEERLDLNAGSPELRPPKLNAVPMQRDPLPPKQRDNLQHPSTYPPVMKMMELAIGHIDDKKGTSIVAIKKWILGNFPEYDKVRLSASMKKALVKGMGDGTFVRPPSTAASAQLSLTGRLRLARNSKGAAKSRLVPKPAKPSKKPVKTKKSPPKVPEPDDEPDSTLTNEQIDTPVAVKKRGKKPLGRKPKAAVSKDEDKENDEAAVAGPSKVGRGRKATVQKPVSGQVTTRKTRSNQKD